MPRLIDMLAPTCSRDIHTVVAELVKGIISMAAPTPAVGISDPLSNGPASNRFARELAHRDSVSKLVNYILCEFGAATPNAPALGGSPSIEPALDPDNAASSVVQSICILIELIRQNNSDYFEPYLFHTLRNRLIQVQQHLQMNTAEGRETLEKAMKDMVDRMGVVNLSPILELLCDGMETLQQFLRRPRSLVSSCALILTLRAYSPIPGQNGPILTTVGALAPLTFERYRICELYAELLHCSNMSLLNRAPEYSHL